MRSDWSFVFLTPGTALETVLFFALAGLGWTLAAWGVQKVLNR